MRNTLYMIIVLAVLGAGATAIAQRAEVPMKRSGKVVLHTTFGSKVRSWDPATCGDTMSARFQTNMYEGLYTYHYLKRPVEIIPQLAAGLPTVSKDGLTWTIKIREGIKYSPNYCFGLSKTGELLTREVVAKDFVLAFKRNMDRHVESGLSMAFIHGRIEGLDDWKKESREYEPRDFKRYNRALSGLKALDSHTLQIKLTKPFPQFRYVLAMHNYAPIPHEALKYWMLERPRQQRVDEKFISSLSPTFTEAGSLPGTGAYMIGACDVGTPIILVRNPNFRKDYYPSEGGPGDKEAGLLDDAGKQVPFIDEIHYRYMGKTIPIWQRFIDGRSAMAGIPLEAFSKIISPAKTLRPVWSKKGVKLVKSTSPTVYWLGFNMRNPVLGGSKSLRQAMCLAFDVEGYIETHFGGRGMRAVNCVPASFAGWKQAGPGRYNKLDREAAKKKLVAAKKELGALGLLDDNGEIPVLELDMTAGAAAARTAKFVKSQFEAIGLKVKVNYSSWPDLQMKVSRSAVQMYMMGWHADYPDSENFLQLFYTPNIALQTNNTCYSNPKYDKLYEKARLMKDSPERTKLYAQMISIISEDCPMVLLSEPISFTLHWDWLKNLKPHPIAYGNTKYLRIDKQAWKAHQIKLLESMEVE